MKKNYVIAFLLSMTVLLIWDRFVVKPRQKTAERAAAEAPAAPAPAGETPVESPAGTAAKGPRIERGLQYEIGENRVTLTSRGGAVKQWEVLENAQWVSLLPEKVESARGLATFEDIDFSIRREGDVIVMEGRRADGLSVKKALNVSAQNHQHQLDLTLKNNGKADIDARWSLGWGPGVETRDEAKNSSRASGGTQRAITFDGENTAKRKAGDYVGDFKWWAVDGHYFMAAFLEDKHPVSLRVVKEGAYFSMSKLREEKLPPRREISEKQSFYLGSKGYEELKSQGRQLDRSIDFGFFAPVGQVIHRVLFFFHNLTGNYGWAIILLTMIIQTLVLPLTMKSFQHGQKMKVLQPQLKRLQELYKNDPRRLNTEMMALYQRHGLRFMGMEGCLPMLIQLPIFWALYSTLRNTYELRHAPWIGWIKDLSAHDPIYVLPVLMGAAMFVQQKQSAAAMDPQQKPLIYMMPVMFTFIFLKMPAGLVIYWFTNSLLSLLVQAYLGRKHPGGAPVEVVR